MRFGDFGQPRVQALLRDMQAKHRVAGSFLFVGPAGVGKEAVAVELGRLLNCTRPGGCEPRGLFATPPRREDGEACASCRRFRGLQHPDLHVLFPAPIDFWERQSPSADATLPDDFRQREPGSVVAVLQGKARDPYHKPMFMRPAGIQAELLRDVVLPAVHRRPVEARTKVVLITDADQMAFGIGNLLLKTLEEPPPGCLLVLTSSVPERLLPTIRSRCQVLVFAPLDVEWMAPRLEILHDTTADEARIAAALAQGSMLLAGRHLDGTLKEIQERAFDILRAAAAGDALQLVELAKGTVSDYSEHRQKLPILLHLLVLVQRDLLLWIEGAVPEAGGPATGPRLAHAARATDLAPLAVAFDSAALRAGIRAAEQAERAIAGYAHTELVLTTLFLGLLPQPSAAPAGRG
jgi:DNA polymerase-3 subunit delta'